MTKKLQDTAPKILEAIQAANSILLHCHPSPDPDSVCSGLAMKEALEQLGKKVTLIKGDSAMPSGFSHFPGFSSIVMKSFAEIDLGQFDLFIVQDSGDPTRVSTATKIEFPKTMKVVLIDHHATNKGFGDVSLVDTGYAATCQMLADLFEVWNISITRDMAANLITGMYTDTGGFKYANTTPEAVATFAKLTKIAPDYMSSISIMENSNTPGNIAFQGLAFSSVENHCGGKLALSVISYEALQSKGVTNEDIHTQLISNTLKSVIGWEVGITLVETEPGKVKASFRTRDQDRFDVSVIAQRVGGGGHRSASGANLNMSLTEAKTAIIDAVSKSV